ncbi:MAG TPA: SIMPL domain-containing protein [Gemmatimonadaceae bacterium]|nr:SIMPL domain-containing protein [Gemmatimonadaceae bacterium]
MKKRHCTLLLGLLAPVIGHAQDNIATLTPLTPQIVVAGHGEVKVSPDRATLQIAVQTRAATATEAAAQNATKQQAVLSALRALGLTNDQLSTINYQVYPEQRYEQGKDPVIVGYNVTNTIVADIRRLDQVGRVIDAALSHGANLISSLEFYASNTQASRRTAIGSAIESARADAEAAARAAGGSLGPLLEINVVPSAPLGPRPLMMAKAAVGQDTTPINPGEQTLSVDVTTRWRFIPGR